VPWIWARADRLRGEAVDVTEILDIYHIREHIWTVAHAVLGTGARSRESGESLAGAVLEHGAAPVLEALARQTITRVKQCLRRPTAPKPDCEHQPDEDGANLRPLPSGAPLAQAVPARDVNHPAREGPPEHLGGYVQGVSE